MLWLCLGLFIFFAVHMGSNNREKRADTIARHGEVAYKGMYSIFSAIGLALIVYGFYKYRLNGYVQLWTPPKAFTHSNILFSSLAMISLTAANLKNGFIKSKLKHPMLVGVKLWAFGHLLANGDLGSLLIFGSFLAYSVFNRIQLKKRGDLGAPAAAFGIYDILSIVIGLGVSYALIKGLHNFFFGVSIL